MSKLERQEPVCTIVHRFVCPGCEGIREVESEFKPLRVVPDGPAQARPAARRHEKVLVKKLGRKLRYVSEHRDLRARCSRMEASLHRLLTARSDFPIWVRYTLTLGLVGIASSPG